MEIEISTKKDFDLAQCTFVPKIIPYKPQKAALSKKHTDPEPCPKRKN